MVTVLMAQRELFEKCQSERLGSEEPDLSAVRERLNGALEELRTAECFPWTQQQLRSWQHVFRNMANWLPEAERREIQDEFVKEVNRWQPHRSTNADD